LGKDGRKIVLNIQKVIKQFDDIKIANYFLMHHYGINVKHKVMGTGGFLYLYNYTPRTPRHHPIGNEARGLILDRNAEVVSQSFKRFHDLESPYNINWENACTEYMKLGEFITIYNFQGQWNIQTRNSILGDEIFAKKRELSYAEEVKSILSYMYKNAWDTIFVEKKSIGGDSWCYSFEVIYEEEYADMILLTIFDKNTGKELDRDLIDSIAFDLGFTRPKSYVVHDLLSLTNVMQDLPDDYAGLMIVDGDNKRTRITNLRYNHKKRKHPFTQIDLVSDVLSLLIDSYNVGGNPEYLIDDFTVGQPKYRELVELVNSEISQIVRELSYSYSSASNLERKDFADMTILMPMSRVLFDLRSGKIDNIEEGIFRPANQSKLTKLIKSRMGYRLDRSISRAQLEMYEQREEEERVT
jgi:hypothetical protein